MFTAILIAASGYIAWKLIEVRDQILHGAEYRKRIAITAANLIDPKVLNNADEVLRLYGVNVVHTIPPFKRWFVGYGIYLGNGAVLTAAHVIGHWPSITGPRVFIDGQDLPAKVVKEGSIERNDLALLSVDQARLPISLRLRRSPLCDGPLQVDTQVIVVYPERIVRSRIISPFLIAPQERSRFGTLIDEPEGSGSGVFDADRKCLLGIVSREAPKFTPEYEGGKIVMKPNAYAGYFVPASKVRKFLPLLFKF